MRLMAFWENGPGAGAPGASRRLCEDIRHPDQFAWDALYHESEVEMSSLLFFLVVETGFEVFLFGSGLHRKYAHCHS